MIANSPFSKGFINPIYVNEDVNSILVVKWISTNNLKIHVGLHYTIIVLIPSTKADVNKNYVSEN